MSEVLHSEIDRIQEIRGKLEVENAKLRDELATNWAAGQAVFEGLQEENDKLRDELSALKHDYAALVGANDHKTNQQVK